LHFLDVVEGCPWALPGKGAWLLCSSYVAWALHVSVEYPWVCAGQKGQEVQKGHKGREGVIVYPVLALILQPVPG